MSLEFALGFPAFFVVLWFVLRLFRGAWPDGRGAWPAPTDDAPDPEAEAQTAASVAAWKASARYRRGTYEGDAPEGGSDASPPDDAGSA